MHAVTLGAVQTSVSGATQTPAAFFFLRCVHRKAKFRITFLGLIGAVIAGTCEALINDVSGACLAREVCIVFDDDHAQTWLAGSTQISL